ncbi:hypothetical protein HDU81_001864 [Chytriomyces hyalinus]|nr:hypothetical protein HDU81_001864 [Chytriomyces hyalinus]
MTATLEALQDTAAMRRKVYGMQRRRQYSNWVLTLQETPGMTFETVFGIDIAMFQALLVRIAPALNTAETAFNVAEDTQLAMFLANCSNAIHSKELRFGIRDPLRATVLRDVGCAVNESIYNRTDKFNVVCLAFERIFGTSFAKIHATLPKERSVLDWPTGNAQLLSDLLQLPKSMQQHPRIVKAGDSIEISSTFRWRPTFVDHPIITDKHLQNLRMVNKKAFFNEEKAILASFLPVLEKRLKRVQLCPHLECAYPKTSREWMEKYGVCSDVFAWIMSLVLFDLTPPAFDPKDQNLYYAADTKLFVFLIAAKNLHVDRTGRSVESLLSDFNETLTMEELIAVVVHVREVLAQKIFTNDVLASHPYILAFEAVFGKFSFLYDMLPKRLGMPLDNFLAPPPNPNPLNPPQPVRVPAAAQIVETVDPRPPTKRPKISTEPATAAAPAAEPAVAVTAPRPLPLPKFPNSDPVRRAASVTVGAEHIKRRASYMPSKMDRKRALYSSSPPSAVKDIRNWRSMFADEGEKVTLDECEPIEVDGEEEEEEEDGLDNYPIELSSPLPEARW